MQSLEQLLGHARAHVAGPEANQALWTLRAELEAAYGSAVLYELVLGEGATWEDLLATHLPRFTEHLQSKGLPRFGAPNVMVAVWRGPTMHVFECGELFDAIGALEGVDRQGLAIRIGDWRERAGLPREPYGRPRPALLPPPPGALPGPGEH